MLLLACPYCQVREPVVARGLGNRSGYASRGWKERQGDDGEKEGQGVGEVVSESKNIEHTAEENDVV